MHFTILLYQDVPKIPFLLCKAIKETNLNYNTYMCLYDLLFVDMAGKSKPVRTHSPDSLT